MKSMKTLVAALVVSGTCLAALARAETPPQDAPDPDEARSTIGKWIATQQIILKERKDWQEGKEILESRIALLEQEISALETKLDSAKAGSQEASRKESELTDASRQLETSGKRLAEVVTGVEGSIRALHGSMPTPVQERLAPLYQRIPEDPSGTKASVGERYQNVLGILNEINKANGEILLVNEIRALSDGTPSEVKSIYVGLGQAYYLSPGGEAGVGRPTPEGWEWTPANELAGNLREVVEILQNKGKPKFITLPVEIR